MALLRIILAYLMLLTGTSVHAAKATPIPYALLHTPTPVPTATPIPTATPVPTPSPTPAPTATPRLFVLKTGSAGTAVRQLQARLQELGYLKEDPDGNYGPKTEEAVRWFQQVNGLEADGIAGRLTQEKLYFDPDVLPAPAE